jgi:hypothetical protein
MATRVITWLAQATVLCAMLIGLGILAEGQQNHRADINAIGKEWLQLMNTDKDNTVDKKEFVGFMASEFARADTDHDGTLDAHELGELRLKLACH